MKRETLVFLGTHSVITALVDIPGTSSMETRVCVCVRERERETLVFLGTHSAIGTHSVIHYWYSFSNELLVLIQ